MKILILIISSQSDPNFNNSGNGVYESFKENWLTYMNNFENIDSYFLQFAEYYQYEPEENVQIEKPYIYCLGQESVIPGCLIKTVQALNSLNLADYNFVIRTNLSSVIDFNLLSEYLASKLDQEYYYAGKFYDYSFNGKPFYFCSGGLCIMSQNISQIVAQINLTDIGIIKLPDDVAMGYAIYKFLLDKYNPQPLDRIDFCPGQLIRYRHNNRFHYRFRNDEDRIRDVIYHRTTSWKLYNWIESEKSSISLVDYQLSLFDPEYYNIPYLNDHCILYNRPILESDSIGIYGQAIENNLWLLLVSAFRQSYKGILCIFDIRQQYFADTFLRCAQGLNIRCQFHYTSIEDKVNILYCYDSPVYDILSDKIIICNRQKTFNINSIKKSNISTDETSHDSVKEKVIVNPDVLVSEKFYNSADKELNIKSQTEVTNISKSDIVNKKDNKITPKILSESGSISKLSTTENYSTKDITLVTGLFDLTIREPNSFRLIEEYLKLGQNLLSIPHNLIIFGDAHLVQEAWAFRCKLNLASKTFIYILALENSPYYKYLPDITAKFKTSGQPAYYTPTKESPLYLIIGWTRFWMLKQLATLNPFKSSAMLWVDYGIFHLYNNADNNSNNAIANNTNIKTGLQHLCRRIISCPKNKLKFVVLKHDNESTFSNLTEYYSTRRWNVAAGLFSGSWNDMIWLGQEINKQIIQCMAGSYPGLEEMMLNIIYVKNRSRFEVYYGDYHQILCNHDRYRSNFDIIERNIRDCLRLKLWPQLIHLTRFLLAGDLPQEKIKYVVELLHLSAIETKDSKLIDDCRKFLAQI